MSTRRATAYIYICGAQVTHTATLPTMDEEESEDEEEAMIPDEQHMLQKVISTREIRRTKEVLCSPIVLGAGPPSTSFIVCRCGDSTCLVLMIGSLEIVLEVWL